MQATASAVRAPAALLQRVVERVLELVPSAEGASVELVEGGELSCVAATGTLAGTLGVRSGLGDGLSGLAVRTGSTCSSDDSTTDPRADPEACRLAGAISIRCVPLRAEGFVAGVVAVTAGRPGAFGGRDVAVVSELADFAAAAMLRAHRSGSRELDWPADAEGPGALGAPLVPASPHGPASPYVPASWYPGDPAAMVVRSLLERGAITMLLQPLVELATTRLAGAEALARFDTEPRRSPNEWFAQGRRVGLGAALQLLAVRRALEAATALPEHAFVAVNLDLEGASHPELPALLAGSPRPVVLELTEDVVVEDYSRLRAALDEMRRNGARLAVDDTGSPALTYLVELAPDLVKLDRAVVQGVEEDPVRQSLVSALVAFANGTGCEVVAEGIETRDEFETLRDLKVRYGQGWLLGRPVAPRLLQLEQAGLRAALEG